MVILLLTLEKTIKFLTLLENRESLSTLQASHKNKSGLFTCTMKKSTDSTTETR